MNSLLVKNLIRNDYKVKKAHEILRTMEKSEPKKYNPQIAIAEMKVVKDHFGPKLFEKYFKDAGVPKSVKYYRDKYGQKGITETVRHLIKSKHYLKFMLFERGLFNGYHNIKGMADWLDNLTYQENDFLKVMREHFKSYYKWE